MPHMGLTSWENAPDGKILKPDVTVAKNYLTREELESLGCIVTTWLHGVMPRDRIPCCRASFGTRCGGMSSQT
jgi:hypothetical protein